MCWKMPAPQLSSSSNLIFFSPPISILSLPVCLTQVDFLVCSHTVFFFFFTCLPLSSSRRKTSGTGSPDSVLKKSLLPSSSRDPTVSSRTSSSSSSSQTDCSSSSAENHRGGKHTSTSRACLSRTTPYPISSSFELISRGPDGRFLIPSYQNDTTGPRSQNVQLTGVRRSDSIHSERLENKEPPFVLSVDFTPCSLTEAVPPSQNRAPAQQHLPRHESDLLDCGRFPDLGSVGSSSSLAAVPTKDSKPTLTFPVLPHLRRGGLGQPATNASALLLQMEHERETGNLSHCLKLAQQREELERELQRYTLGRSSVGPERSCSERRDSELLWEYKSRTVPRRHPQSRTQRSALSSSDISTPPPGWELSALDLTRAYASMSQNERPAMSFTTGPRLRCGEAGGGSADRWTLPRWSSEKNNKVEAAPKGCGNSPQAALAPMPTGDSRGSLGRSSVSTLSFRSSKGAQRADWAHSSRVEALFRVASGEKVSAEMSVDEPELEESATTPSKRMLHHRIAAHLQHSSWPATQSQYEDMRSSAGVGGGSIRSPPPESRLELSRVPGSRIWNSVLRSQSLDLRRQQEEEFLPPDAWINSLSQENCSLLPSARPRSSVLEKVLSSRTISKSPADFPSTSQPPPSGHSLSPKESSESLPLKNETSPNSGSQINECGLRRAFAESRGSSEMRRNGSTCVPEDNHLDALEMEAGSFEVAPQSGSYSSYASSGRGSMGAPNGRLSVSHLPPSLTTSHQTTEESREETHDEGPYRY